MYLSYRRGEKQMTKTKINFDMESIGSRLKEIRHHLNLKQKELAEILNITTVTLSNIEVGNKIPGSDILFILSEVYRVNLAYLMHGEGNMFRSENEMTGVFIGGGAFGEYTDTVKEILWFMQNSLLARSAIIALATEYLYNNEDLLKKDIERLKIKKEKK